MTCLGIIQTESYEELDASTMKRHIYLVCVIYLSPRITITRSLVNSEAEYHCLPHAMAQMSLCCLVSHAQGRFPQLAQEQCQASLSWEWAGSSCQGMAKWALPALTCSWLLERTKVTGLIWKESSRRLAAAYPAGAPQGMGTGLYSLFRVSREMLGEPTCPRLLCEALHCLGFVQKGCCSAV